MSNVIEGTFQPEYIFITEEEEGLVPFRICELAILGIERDGKRLYKHEKEFGNSIVGYEVAYQGPKQSLSMLYRLDVENFQPF